jgi:sec-independent protein translocase protein TatC
MFLVMIPLVALYFLAAAITYLNDKRRAKKVAKFDEELNAENPSND